MRIRSQFARAAIVASIALPGFASAAEWGNVEADNGAVYRVDVSSIFRYPNGTADIVVYAVEGDQFNPENQRKLWFDCKGHYRDQTAGVGPKLYAPPRSVAGRISAIACAGARDARLDATPKQPKDTPEHYCAGFSRDACARIQAGVEAKAKPPFCKPGFGLAASGLTPEQLRICYARADE